LIGSDLHRSRHGRSQYSLRRTRAERGPGEVVLSGWM
jgi:hypothetical protein